MSGSKLDMCKETLVVLLKELKSTDRFALTIFHHEAEVVIPLNFLVGAARDLAINRVKLIETQGCTNLSGGLTLAIGELQKCTTPNPVRSVLLLTDGHANRGVSSEDGILSLAKGCLGLSKDISVNVMGYGSDHNADLLQKISQTSATAGSYYFIDTNENVSSAFGDCLGGLLSVSAQNIVMKVTGVPGVEVKHERATKLADGSGWTVALGDMFAEESKDVVISGPYGTATIECQIEYVDVIMSLPVVSDVVSCSVVQTSTSTLAPANAHVALQHLRVAVVQAMKLANDMSRGDRMVEARALMAGTLEDIARTATELGSRLSEEDRSVISMISMLTADCTDCLSSMTSYAEYEKAGSKKMMQKMQTHQAQRCNEASEETTNIYRGSAVSGKSRMARKFKGSVGLS